jgi:hypothetical protein
MLVNEIVIYFKKTREIYIKQKLIGRLCNADFIEGNLNGYASGHISRLGVLYYFKKILYRSGIVIIIYLFLSDMSSNIGKFCQKPHYQY